MVSPEARSLSHLVESETTVGLPVGAWTMESWGLVDLKPLKRYNHGWRYHLKPGMGMEVMDEKNSGFSTPLTIDFLPISTPLTIDFLPMLKLEKAMALYSSILAWKIPWTEEPGRLQSMGSLRDGRD